MTSLTSRNDAELNKTCYCCVLGVYGVHARGRKGRRKGLKSVLRRI